MRNQEIAKILNEISEYLKMGEKSFRPYAYQRAALALESLKEDVSSIYKNGGKKALEEIPGIGESIAQSIEEYIKTGKVNYYEQFKKKLPLNLNELIGVEGIGPKKVKFLYLKLGIKNIKDLEKAAKSHKIAPLFGFGEKTEENILEGIEFLKRSKGRLLLGEVLPKVREIYAQLKDLKEVENISYAGSLRRMKETVGDVDILITSKNPLKVMDFFVSLPEVVKIWGKGKTKSSVRLEEGFDMDLRVVSEKSYGAALQYFTGSKDHNIITRKIAMYKGLKLSEYGLFKGSKIIASKTEEDVYKALGMGWIPPELRENNGEIEAAIKHKLPNIISYKDIKGDLHCHSQWNGGDDSILAMAEFAISMGYEYIGISDHTKFLRIESGLNEKQLSEQKKEIDELNTRLRASFAEVATKAEQGFGGQAKFKILQGCEANIMADGSIDIKDEALKNLDYAIAGVHSSFKMEKDQMTERIIKAMRNPYIKIISHPTGRILKKRDEYQIDLGRILKAAKEYNIALEINSSPVRLDLNDQNIKRAKEAGVKMIINTDAHQKEQMNLMEFGISQARRGWAEKEDIINTQSLEGLLKFLKQ